MSKARTLAGTVSDGAVLADGTVGYAEVSGAPTAPTGTVVGTTDTQTLTNKTINIANNTLTGVQPTLVSGTSIKTINGGSVLGSGDLAVGGGSWIFLSTVTASGASTVNIETTFDSTYDQYAIVLTNITHSELSTTRARFKISGSYQTTNYTFVAADLRITSSYDAASGTGISSIAISAGNSANTASNATANYIIYLNNPSSTTKTKTIFWDGFTLNNGGGWGRVVGGAAWEGGTGALTGIQFFGLSGNISGTFRLYGIKNS
jgi:hypothetical protein